MSEFTPAASIQEEVLTNLLLAPTRQAIINFHASEYAQARLSYLLDANRQGILSAEENAELAEASQLNHFIILLKAKAQKAIQSS